MKLTIETVKEVVGFLPSSCRYPNQYNGNRLVSHGYEAKALLINGKLEDGRNVFFYTPTAVVMTCEGMLNYKTLQASNGWFEETKSEYVGHKNALHYEGSSEMSVAIECKSEIKPTVFEGEEIEISFKVKRECTNGKLQLTFVKLSK